MLPGSSFFLGIPFAPAKQFIESGLGIALASDYNPGSSPSGDMRFVMALGCIRMRLTPIQAFNAVTLNSAYAMGVAHLAGSVTPGKIANLIVTDPGWNLTKIPYLHHTPFIRIVILRGRSIFGEGLKPVF
jgi:imidazolonepropionase